MYFQGSFRGVYMDTETRFQGFQRFQAFNFFMALTSTIFLATLSAYDMPRPMWHKCNSKTRGQHNKQKQDNTVYCMNFSFLVKMKNVKTKGSRILNHLNTKCK